MKKKSSLTFYLTIIYLTLMIWIIFFKMSSLSELGSLDLHRKINLIPFHYDSFHGYNRLEIIYNFLIFIPLGLYFKMLNFNIFQSILYGFSISLSFETLQFIFGLGVSDITDIITNSSGVIFGIVLYFLLYLLFRKSEQLNKFLQVSASICTIIFILLITILYFANS